MSAEDICLQLNATAGLLPNMTALKVWQVKLQLVTLRITHICIAAAKAHNNGCSSP